MEHILDVPYNFHLIEWEIQFAENIYTSMNQVSQDMSRDIFADR